MISDLCDSENRANCGGSLKSGGRPFARLVGLCLSKSEQFDAFRRRQKLLPDKLRRAVRMQEVVKL